MVEAGKLLLPYKQKLLMLTKKIYIYFKKAKKDADVD